MEETNKYEGLEEQVELMTSLSYDDWDINQHYCWKVSCNKCKLRKPPNQDGSNFTYGECRNYARIKADELKEGELPSEYETPKKEAERPAECETPKYEKFIILHTEDGQTLKSIPCTGINLTLDIVKELLESGKYVQVHPYTREAWNRGEEMKGNKT